MKLQICYTLLLLVALVCLDKEERDLHTAFRNIFKESRFKAFFEYLI